MGDLEMGDFSFRPNNREDKDKIIKEIAQGTGEKNSVGLVSEQANLVQQDWETEYKQWEQKKKLSEQAAAVKRTAQTQNQTNKVMPNLQIAQESVQPIPRNRAQIVEITREKLKA